jgi:hypothetical protein
MNADLKLKARQALASRAAGDGRWPALVATLALATDLPAARIITFIESLAA